MANYHELYQIWANDPYFDAETHAELKDIAGDETAIKERFYRYLEFGTGGLRGIIGAGTNYMNKYTVALATEAFAEYISQRGEAAKAAGVCISYDSRKHSQEFAEITGLVFAAHGIKARLFSELHPTPMLSYAVRYFKAAAGVMITASHNPGKYNGYKAYGEDGGQLPPAAADVVIAAMNKIKDIRDIKPMDKAAAKAAGLFEYITPKMDEAYFDMLLKISINGDLVAKHKDMKIVYTPLNGAGNKPVRAIWKKMGFKNIIVVPEQELPDPEFKTCSYPNPEERAALQLAIDLAAKEKADIVIATDPDSDRTGCCVRLANGEYQVLTGNQIGMLLMDYVLSARQVRGTLPKNSFVATTIVSTRLAHQVAAHFGVKLYEVLTGFKYIGELIKNLDENGDAHFQFGFEESYGYLAETEVRDKDAVVGAMLLAELAVTAAEAGQTLADRLNDCYAKYGYGEEKTVSITLEGLAGIEKIKNALDKLRKQSVNEFAGYPLTARRDYQLRVRCGYRDGKLWQEDLTLPQSNVLLYEFDGLDWACVRPSGTEPKLKIYCGCYGTDKAMVQERLAVRAAKIKAAIEAEL